MQACADWLKPLIPEILAEWIAMCDTSQVPLIRV
jgi:hypothetical protein